MSVRGENDRERGSECGNDHDFAAQTQPDNPRQFVTLLSTKMTLNTTLKFLLVVVLSASSATGFSAPGGPPPGPLGGSTPFPRGGPLAGPPAGPPAGPSTSLTQNILNLAFNAAFKGLYLFDTSGTKDSSKVKGLGKVSE